MTASDVSDLVGRTIRLTRVFNAPRELVFRTWIEPRHIMRWRAPRGWSVPHAEVDARVGGEIRVDMQGAGTPVYPNVGTIREIDPPKRLVFTQGMLRDALGTPAVEALYTVTFTEHGGQTTLELHGEILRATPEFAAAIQGMEEGWNQTLDKLAETLADDHDIVITRKGAT